MPKSILLIDPGCCDDDKSCGCGGGCCG